MDKRLRYLAMAVLVVLVIGGFFAANALMKPAGPAGVGGISAATGKAVAPRMAIEGDPRMLVCQGPAGSSAATPEALAALELAGPLVREDGETAAYRFIVFRGAGKPIEMVRFATSQTSRNTAVVANWSGVAGEEPKVDRFNVAHGPAMLIYGAWSTSAMWGTPKPLMATRLVGSTEGVVLEVASDRFNRCVATRFDDERIRPVAEALSGSLVGYLKTTSLAAIVAPDREYQPASGGSR